MFYSTYHDVVSWERNGEVAKTNSGFRCSNPSLQRLAGVGYGKEERF